MKTWFNGDSEGRIKRGTSNRKGTLSDELSKADYIGRQLRYNEVELNQLQEQKIQENTQPVVKTTEDKKTDKEEISSKRGSIQMSAPFPPRRQAVEERVEKSVESVEEKSPIQMSAPFPPRPQLRGPSKEGNVAKDIIQSAPQPLEIEIPSPFSPTTFDTLIPSQNLGLGSVSTLGDMKDYSYSDKYEGVYEEPCESYATKPIQNVMTPVESQPKMSLKSNIIISFDKEQTMELNMNIAAVITILNSSGAQFDFKITNDGQGGQNLNIIAPSHTIYQILALFE